ncbi:hypothetical protein DIPPA_20225 [Diplonema papillatum]|nr:hypothetical protein DIPPA_20225 [Diplonema papillatum]
MVASMGGQAKRKQLAALFVCIVLLYVGVAQLAFMPGEALQAGDALGRGAATGQQHPRRPTGTPPAARPRESAAPALPSDGSTFTVEDPPALPAEGVPTRYSDFVLRKKTHGLASGADNSEGVTEDDVARWRGTRIAPLPVAGVIPAHAGSPDDARWRVVGRWLPVGETYPDPVSIEFTSPGAPGALLGAFYTTAHRNASVLSLTFGARPAHGPPVAPSRRRLSVALPPRAELYAPFFRSCHLFNNAFLLGPWEALEGRGLLAKAAGLSRVVYVEIPEKDEDAFADELERLQASVRPIGTVTDLGAAGASVIYRVAVQSVDRVCRKTWVAGEVHWKRSIALEYSADTGAVTFRVKSPTASLGRTIDPMAFVPHVNLETLGALGLTPVQKVRVLAEQVATPRYPDPFPHNWIWNGRISRIDKVDHRYEQDVDEAATYWGADTLGYLTLLSDNLCMAQLKSGFPKAMLPCKAPCGCCAATCSYKPKPTKTPKRSTWGQPVCAACLACSQCMLDNVEEAAEHNGAADKAQCPFEKYTNWNAAVKLWKKWASAAATAKKSEPWYPAAGECWV